MRKFCLRIGIASTAAIVCFMTHEVPAEMMKNLRIESVPPGADVYLPQGTRNQHIGKTPFTYPAEFHSEISIIRMLFKKKTYRDVTLAVSAKEDRVVAKLDPVALTLDPDAQRNKHLQRLQEAVNPVINRMLRKMLESTGQASFDLAGPVIVTESEGMVNVCVPLTLESMGETPKGTGNKRREKFMRVLWERGAASLAVSLAKELQTVKEVSGIVLHLDFSEQRYLFSVGHTVEEKIEMVCVPGTRTEYVYDMCARINSQTGNCEGGNVLRSVYDPCANRAPVTKRTVKADPASGMTRDRGHIYYVLQTAVVRENATASSLYDKLGVYLTDSQKKELAKRGRIPPLPICPRDYSNY